MEIKTRLKTFHTQYNYGGQFSINTVILNWLLDEHWLSFSTFCSLLNPFFLPLKFPLKSCLPGPNLVHVKHDDLGNAGSNSHNIRSQLGVRGQTLRYCRYYFGREGVRGQGNVDRLDNVFSECEGGHAVPIEWVGEGAHLIEQTADGPHVCLVAVWLVLYQLRTTVEYCTYHRLH